MSLSKLALILIFLFPTLCVITSAPNGNTTEKVLPEIIAASSTTTTAIPPFISTSNSTTKPPKTIPETSNITKGVKTILHGVSTFRLSEILRGSFMFTKNQQVRDVANSVIDTIFGERNETGPQDNEQGLFPLSGF